MITAETVNRIVRFQADGLPVVTLYCRIDPGASAREVHTRVELAAVRMGNYPDLPARGGDGRLGQGVHLPQPPPVWLTVACPVSCSAAMRASWTREVMSSFQKMWRRWNATVCVLRNSRFATWRLLSPSATRSTIRSSVPVRLSQPKAGRSAWVQCRSRVPAARRLDRTRARSP